MPITLAKITNNHVIRSAMANNTVINHAVIHKTDYEIFVNGFTRLQVQGGF